MLSPSSKGVVLTVRAAPRAGRSSIAGERAGALLVRLAAAPMDGAANEELVSLLSSVLRIPKRYVSVIAGERARDKRVLIQGLPVEEIRTRLQI